MKGAVQSPVLYARYVSSHMSNCVLRHEVSHHPTFLHPPEFEAYDTEESISWHNCVFSSAPVSVRKLVGRIYGWEIVNLLIKKHQIKNNWSLCFFTALALSCVKINMEALTYLGNTKLNHQVWHLNHLCCHMVAMQNPHHHHYHQRRQNHWLPLFRHFDIRVQWLPALSMKCRLSACYRTA
jgi:hypothetical protein